MQLELMSHRTRGFGPRSLHSASFLFCGAILTTIARVIGSIQRFSLSSSSRCRGWDAGAGMGRDVVGWGWDGGGAGWGLRDRAGWGEAGWGGVWNAWWLGMGWDGTGMGMEMGVGWGWGWDGGSRTALDGIGSVWIESDGGRDGFRRGLRGRMRGQANQNAPSADRACPKLSPQNVSEMYPSGPREPQPKSSLSAYTFEERTLRPPLTRVACV